MTLIAICTLIYLVLSIVLQVMRFVLSFTLLNSSPAGELMSETLNSPAFTGMWSGFGYMLLFFVVILPFLRTPISWFLQLVGAPAFCERIADFVCGVATNVQTGIVRGAKQVGQTAAVAAQPVSLAVAWELIQASFRSPTGEEPHHMDLELRYPTSPARKLHCGEDAAAASAPAKPAASTPNPASAAPVAPAAASPAPPAPTGAAPA